MGTGTPITTRGFTGHEMVDALGIIHMNGRIYDPKLGRFLTPDGIVPDATNPQALNRYAYAYNNPVRLTDPSGHSPQDEIDNEKAPSESTKGQDNVVQPNTAPSGGAGAGAGSSSRRGSAPPRPAPTRTRSGDGSSVDSIGSS